MKVEPSDILIVTLPTFDMILVEYDIDPSVVMGMIKLDDGVNGIVVSNHDPLRLKVPGISGDGDEPEIEVTTPVVTEIVLVKLLGVPFSVVAMIVTVEEVVETVVSVPELGLGFCFELRDVVESGLGDEASSVKEESGLVDASDSELGSGTVRRDDEPGKDDCETIWIVLVVAAAVLVTLLGIILASVVVNVIVGSEVI